MPDSGTLRLMIREPGQEEREVTFTQDRITIGRAPDCDLSLESGFISRYHARLERTDTGWQIADEDSKNGVFVNGQRVSGTQLVRPGDSLRIGDFNISVEASPAVEPIRPWSGAQSPEPDPLPPQALEQPLSAAVEGVIEPGSIPMAKADSTLEPAEATGPAAPEEEMSSREPRASEPLAAPRLSFEDTGRGVRLDGRSLSGELSPHEVELLWALAAAGPAGGGGAALIEAIWGIGGGDGEMLGRLVYRVRGKLDAELIQDRSGGGYRLNDR